MSRILTLGCACLLLTGNDPRAISATPDGDDEVHASRRGASWHSTPQEWTYTQGYTDIKDYADRPDEPTLKALGVEWQKPELDALGNFCIVRGQVRMPEDSQKRMRPISWFQGVTVYLGTTPGARPNWSKGMDRADTLKETAVTSPSGFFHVRFDLRETKYDRNRGQSFQLGVALAQHIVHDRTSHKVVWNSRVPALPSTVQVLSIPAARELPRELLLINRASGWPFSNPNGVELIRAVNALRPLGKERALAVLERYVELTQDPRDFSDQEIVFWIIRVLFKPIRLDDRIPSPMIAVFLDDREFAEAIKWPLNPMEVSGDIPFMVGRQVGMGGVPEHPSSHIRWARLHGVIRDDPLVPTENPLAAAEVILKSRRFQALDKFSREQGTMFIYSQALAMVEGLLEPFEPHDADRDDRWKARLKVATERGIHWDAKREQFVTAE
jgi:hypothetical protein